MRVAWLAGLVILALSQRSVAGLGQWVFLLHGGNGAGKVHFTGAAGAASPISISASVFNNDSSHTLSFDGITLKTDDLFPPDPGLFARLWIPEPAMEMPEAFLLPASGKRAGIVLGHFDLRNAEPGTYTFRLIASASFDGVQANPPEIVSPPITIQVVPEPASLLALTAGLGSLAGLLRRRR
ncbi:MAG: hypothetical protein KatS3mg024_1360 [Armatimonadota bacterium]|nr:MAG: hypothetical protein KatS3mg024_1360 [Armatimonadota bacterium]